ncbi:MAG TPA: hypothetical protein VK249_09195, partial [Anaerolineales bacterium]|nr:hypothetical protein [Anaerolineales bacterium]
SILLLCSACVPRALLTAEPSPAVIATHSSPTPAATSTLLLPNPIPIFDVVIDNLAIGPQGQLYASGYGNGGQQLPQAQLAQWDGEKWIALDTGFQPEMDALVVDNVGQFYAEFFTDSQQGLSNAIMRWDGARWEDITANFGTVVDPLRAGRVSSNIPVVALAMDGEDSLYAAGSFYYSSGDYTTEFPMGYVAKWNQKTWTVLGKGFDKVYIFALVVSPTGEVYIAGEQPRTPEGNSSYIAHWDGETWKQIDTSKINTSGYLALDKSGGLYVSSLTSEPNGYIDYWNGTNWRTITAQLGGDAPAIYDMTVDANGHLFIGGSFESINGIPAQYIAYWDGSSWHELGKGFNKQVNALAFDPGGDLYAAGLFTDAGGLPVPHIARWDGQTWHALGP